LPSFFRVATDRFSLLFSHAFGPCFLLRRVSWHRVYRFVVWIFRADGRMDEVGWAGRLMGRVRSKSTDSKDVVGLECLLLSTADDSERMCSFWQLVRLSVRLLPCPVTAGYSLIRVGMFYGCSSPLPVSMEAERYRDCKRPITLILAT
jgi:hypothetical protein